MRFLAHDGSGRICTSTRSTITTAVGSPFCQALLVGTTYEHHGDADRLYAALLSRMSQIAFPALRFDVVAVLPRRWPVQAPC